MNKVRDTFALLDPLARITMLNKIDDIDALKPIL